MLDGRIYSGRTGRAGEIGHNIVDPHGPPCLCGNPVSYTHLDVYKRQMLVHEGSILAVILNGMRLLRYRLRD